jgi:hypothetical protein
MLFISSHPPLARGILFGSTVGSTWVITLGSTAAVHYSFILIVTESLHKMFDALLTN